MRVRNLVLGSLLLVLAGCGTAAEGDAADAAAREKQSVQDATRKYVRCMRDNGVPDFPDPEIGGDGELSLALPEGVDRAKADAAHEKCRKHMPNDGEPERMAPEDIAAQRDYSRCMRENGVPKFPDPEPGGGIKIEGGPGLDPMSEEFKAADEKCRTHMPGDGGSFNSKGEK